MRPGRSAPERAPGLEKPRRFRPRLHYELLVCGLRGHELEGTDAAELREQDRIFAREDGAVRWYRCLRCDSWLPLPPPDAAARRHPPGREEIALPLRGRPLRDKIVLRVIAIDRAVHFLILGLLSVAVFVLAANHDALRADFYRVLADLQGGVANPGETAHHGLLGDIDKLLSLGSGTLRLVAVVLAAYAILEGIEAVGLWLQKRWAEYLTFIVTTTLLPLEIYELTRTVSPFKVIAFTVNVAIVVYLLLAKRLFGLRGGAAADEAVRAEDVGWPALERSAPEAFGASSPPAT